MLFSPPPGWCPVMLEVMSAWQRRKLKPWNLCHAIHHDHYLHPKYQSCWRLAAAPLSELFHYMGTSMSSMIEIISRIYSENRQPLDGTIQPLGKSQPRSTRQLRWGLCWTHQHPPPFHPMVEAHQQILLRHLPHAGTSSASALPPS